MAETADECPHGDPWGQCAPCSRHYDRIRTTCPPWARDLFRHVRDQQKENR